jgi:phage/plasmid-associated DNA primase
VIDVGTVRIAGEIGEGVVLAMVGDPGDDGRKLTAPAERSGLLNRALDGLDRRRKADRFTTSDSIRQASADFRVSVDSAAGFLTECVVFAKDGRTKHADLFNGYRNWCEMNGRRPLGAQRFHHRVREIGDEQAALQPDGLDTSRINGWPTYLGIQRRESM